MTFEKIRIHWSSRAFIYIQEWEMGKTIKSISFWQMTENYCIFTLKSGKKNKHIFELLLRHNTSHAVLMGILSTSNRLFFKARGCMWRYVELKIEIYVYEYNRINKIQCRFKNIIKRFRSIFYYYYQKIHVINEELLQCSQKVRNHISIWLNNLTDVITLNKMSEFVENNNSYTTFNH